MKKVMVKRVAIDISRITILVLVSLGFVGCATTPETPPPTASTATVCSDPRPMICTMEYRPVCATLVAGGEKTYPSGCNACADVAVAAWRPEACESDQQQR